MPDTATQRRLKRTALSLGVAALAIAVIAPAVGAANAKTNRIAVNGGGKQANATSWYPSTSANGRFVAFSTEASNLAPGDSNGEADVFVRDRKTGKTRRVSVKTGGGQALGGDSDYASISANGRFVAFQSDATNLVGNDTNGFRDIFVHDRWTKKTKRVSLKNGGGQASGGDSGDASISANGRYVAFQSGATDLVGGDSNGKRDIFVHDRQTKRTKRVSVTSSGGQALGFDSYGPVISGNGRFVAFSTKANNLVANDTNGVTDVFLFDRKTKKLRRVNVRTDGGQALHKTSSEISLSANGRYVAFASSAPNLVGNDTNASTDVFVHDRWKKKTKRVSIRTNGAQASKSSYNSSISANGRYVAFSSDAGDLVWNDNNGTSDVFMRDLVTKRTKRISVRTSGTEGAFKDSSEDPSISADGRFISFSSDAALVRPDKNAWEIFMRGPLR